MTTEKQLARDIGHRIARLRRDRALTQEQLAERAGITHSYLGRIEIGDRLPTLTILAQLAEGLGVPLWRCLTDPGERAVRDPSTKLSRAAVGLTEKEVQLLVAVAKEMKRRR